MRASRGRGVTGWRGVSAVLLVLLTFVAPVSAATGPTASDGRALSGEPSVTQALFASVWGARAAQRWIEEHNAELAGLHAVPDASSDASDALPAHTPDGAIVTPIAYQAFQNGFM